MIRSPKHLWLVESPDQPTALGVFLAGMPGPFSGEADWHPRVALNDATCGFNRLVVAAIKTQDKVHALCALIAQNPHRLQEATSRLAIITPWAPTLSDAELQAADMILKLPETHANGVRATEAHA